MELNTLDLSSCIGFYFECTRLLEEMLVLLLKFNEFLFLESVDPFSGRPLKLCINSINIACLCHQGHDFIYIAIILNYSVTRFWY
jgi:hypothetical protein